MQRQIDKPKVPVRRNDEPTIEERLTDNALHNILPARYQKKNQYGENVEDVSEIFERVAKNLSVAEVAHHDTEVEVPPSAIKKVRRSRAEEMKEEEFGTATPDEDETVVVTEENAYVFGYDNIVEYLPEDVRADVEEVRNRFQDQIEHLNLMPNTPTIVNAGNDMQMLSACFVMSPDDDMRSIHETIADASEIFQAGGGVGYDFSALRPYGRKVGGSGRHSSGPLEFMRTFDQACSTIAQAGVRRGAQMGIMRVTHPDIPFFIHSKNKAVSLAKSLLLDDKDDMYNTSFGDAYEEAKEIIENQSDADGNLPKFLRNAIEGHLSNFNVSVAVTDEFMEALENGDTYTFHELHSDEPYIANEKTKELYGWFDLEEYVEVGEPLEIPAEVIWNRIAQGAHENGEPGVVFIDRVNEHNSFDAEMGDDQYIYATNPCGEEPLMENDACNLAHINLSTIVSNSAEYQLYPEYLEENPDGSLEDFMESAIDFDELDQRVADGVRLLDNVVTMSDFPVDAIDETVRDNRKIGLGIMGLAQLFVQLGIEYGSEESVEFSEEIMTYINHLAKTESHSLAQQRGPFSTWEESKYANPTDHAEWFERHVGRNPSLYEDDGFAMRNHKTTTIAPTGTTSMIANTTGGCEPMYNVAYYKNVSSDVQGEEMLVEFDDYFLDTLEANDIDVDAVKEEAHSQMEENKFAGVSNLDTVPDEIGNLFITTGELTPLQHASIQCALQKGVDSAISKTLNAPNDSTVEDAEQIFEEVYNRGGKGVTYYRDGSRSKQVLTTRKENVDFAEDDEVLDVVEKKMDSESFRQEIADLLVTAVSDDGSSIDDFIEDLRSGVVGDIQASDITPKSRDKELYGVTTRIETGYGKLYVTINHDEYGNPREIFSNIGKSGSVMNSFSNALCMVISLALRSGVSVDEVIDKLEGIRSPKVAWDEQEQIMSIPDAFAVALTRFQQGDITPHPDSSVQTATENTVDVLVDQGTTDSDSSPILENGADNNTDDSEPSKGGFEPDMLRCPDCGNNSVIISQGCKECTTEDCPWSKC